MREQKIEVICVVFEHDEASEREARAVVVLIADGENGRGGRRVDRRAVDGGDVDAVMPIADIHVRVRRVTIALGDVFISIAALIKDAEVDGGQATARRRRQTATGPKSDPDRGVMAGSHDESVPDSNACAAEATTSKPIAITKIKRKINPMLLSIRSIVPEPDRYGRREGIGPFSRPSSVAQSFFHDR